MVKIRNTKRSRTNTYLVFQWSDRLSLFDGHLCDVEVTGEDGPREIAHDVFERFEKELEFADAIALVSLNALGCLIQGRCTKAFGPVVEAQVWHRNDRWGTTARTTLEQQVERWEALQAENALLLAKWKTEDKARKSA